jgi:nucleoside-diphosphate-sugar epimerase
MMKVFLTGATGYVGSVVAEKLLENNHEVLGLARNDGENKLIEKGIEPLRGDLIDLESLKTGARQSDAVIHTAFGHDFANFDKMVQNELDAVAAFTEVLQNTGKPFIATSAPAFLGDTGDEIANENYPIDESSYFAIRARAEKAILAANEQGVRAVVLRLPFYVYGRAGSTFVPVLIEKAKHDGAALYVETGAQKVSAVAVEDAARLYVAALENEQSRGLYNVAAESVTNREIAESIAKLTGVKAESVSLADANERFGALTGFMTINNQISAAKAKSEIGWQPQVEAGILQDIETGSYTVLRI